MAERWKSLHVLALAGLCVGGVAQAQQPGEPPQYYYQPQPQQYYYQGQPQPGAYPPPYATSQPAWPVAPAQYVAPAPAPISPMPQAAPLPASQSAGYNPQKMYSGAIMAPGEISVVQTACENCGAGGSNSGGLAHIWKGNTCSCSGNGDGSDHIKPIRHLLLMDCWAHHDEYGCSSLCSELRFAFGSCRDYFGERCGPNAPAVPVPPGYTYLRPDVRNGRPVEVPPNPYPYIRQ